ncbi:MAG: glycosyltransferase family 2 protein, partial [Nonlabens ulvanivorans]
TSQVKNESMVVYDFKLLKTSAVMADMKRNAKQDIIVFRFLSKNCKFILGSDSASSRGEVLRF